MRSTARYLDECRFRIKVEVECENDYFKTQLREAGFVAYQFIGEELEEYVQNHGNPLDVADLYDKLLLWSVQASREIVGVFCPDQKYEELTEEAKPTVNIHVELESL